MRRADKIGLVIVLVLGISILHYVTNLRLHLQHIVYRDLYFFPIFLAGFWFGLRGALLTSLSITGAYLPFILIHWTNFSSNFNNITQMVLFNVVAVTIGLLVDRERAENEQLREAERLAAMGRAFSALAHDVKTPLVAIGGFSRMVQRKLTEGDPNREKLDIVVHETRRLENMLKEVLDFTRPLELQPARGDINESINHSLSIVAGVAECRQVKLEGHTSRQTHETLFDKDRMEQALINLLMNAIQASPEGKTVIVSSHLRKHGIEIQVKDNGCGIPGENMDKLFLPFFSTKKEGTGLGLPVVRKIVDAHGGKIEILRNQPEGTIFTVLLPLK